VRFELGSPRRLLALLGAILILFVIGAQTSSALLGLVLVIGVVLLLTTLVWTVRIRRRTR
jgi:Flp pilus assembly protein TadB